MCRVFRQIARSILQRQEGFSQKSGIAHLRIVWSRRGMIGLHADDAK